MQQKIPFGYTTLSTLYAMMLLIVSFAVFPGRANAQTLNSHQQVNQAFAQAANTSGVPVVLLKAICFLEGRLSNHQGSPSIDGGYGCMHLVKNKHTDTLDVAAAALHVSPDLLKSDIATNIRGGA